MQSQPDTQTKTRKREEHLSNDGQWRSFPKVPHLLQYVSNGNYYGRIKIGGKVIRESLKTAVWTTAKLRLTDFLKKHQEARIRVDPPKFSAAVAIFEADLTSDTTIKPRSKEYRLLCLKKIQASWPGLWDLPLDEITSQACKEWAAELSKEIASHYYNNTIGTLRQVLQVLDAVDIRTAWTELRALENRSQRCTLAQIAHLEQSLPFALLGLDSDNGGEFINHHLAAYLGQRPKPVLFTRGRPYHKNDNARVEQRNWTHDLSREREFGRPVQVGATPLGDGPEGYTPEKCLTEVTIPVTLLMVQRDSRPGCG